MIIIRYFSLFSVTLAKAAIEKKCMCQLTLVSFVAMCQIRTVWSLEQLAISSPQGLTLAILTHSLWPVRVLMQYPVATSHILMVLSRDALTTKSPCGTNDTELTLWSCPCIVFTQANDWWKSHSFIDMSALHDTRSLPDGSNATSCTLSVWPFRVRSNSPLSKSHTCVIFSTILKKRSDLSLLYYSTKFSKMVRTEIFWRDLINLNIEFVSFLLRLLKELECWIWFNC